MNKWESNILQIQKQASLQPVNIKRGTSHSAFNIVSQL